jgi:hypothetical protein
VSRWQVSVEDKWASEVVAISSTKWQDKCVTKAKVSATVDPDRLARAKKLTGCESTSEVLDRGLRALIEDQLERAQAEGYAHLPQGDDVVPQVDSNVWADLPWDVE